MAKRTFRISVWGETWKVTMKKNLHSGKDKCFGLCDYENRTIYIDPAQGEAEMMDTVIHEVVHAATKGSLSEAYTMETGRAVSSALLALNFVVGD